MPKNFLSPIAIGGKGPFHFVMSMPGVLTTGVGTIRLPVPRPITITNVIAQVGTPPTGASLIFDINVDGTTIFSSGKPTIAAAGTQDLTSVPTTQAVAAGSYITVDIDQVGSTVAGADAVILIEYY